MAAGLPTAAPEAAADEYADMLKAVPQLAALGPIFKTSRPVQVRAWAGRGEAVGPSGWGAGYWGPMGEVGWGQDRSAAGA